MSLYLSYYLLIYFILQQTVHVERESLVSLTQESLEKDDGIARLEAAVTELYKALLAGRDNGMLLIDLVEMELSRNISRYGCHNGKIGRIPLV